MMFDVSFYTYFLFPDLKLSMKLVKFLFRAMLSDGDASNTPVLIISCIVQCLCRPINISELHAGICTLSSYCICILKKCWSIGLTEISFSVLFRKSLLFM